MQGALHHMFYTGRAPWRGLYHVLSPTVSPGGTFFKGRGLLVNKDFLAESSLGLLAESRLTAFKSHFSHDQYTPRLFLTEVK